MNIQMNVQMNIQMCRGKSQDDELTSSFSDDKDEIAPYMMGPTSSDAVKDKLGEYNTI